MLRLLENAYGITKLTNINVNNINNTKKILNTAIRQYIDFYVPIRLREVSPSSRINSNDISIKYISEQIVAVPYTSFSDSLSPDMHVPEQVNIQTDLAKDTKHVVVSRLMRYLQRIDNQDSGYGFQTVSTKTLATTKLVRTLPEKILHQRERRKNIVNLSKDPHPGSDIRVIRDKDDNFVHAGIDKTQASEIQIEKTGLFSELQHLKMPDTPRSDEYTDQVTADISGVGVSENSKVRGIILHPHTNAEEKILEIDTIMIHIQKRNKQVYEKHDSFHRRTADRHLLTKKNNIANKSISNTHIARLKMSNMEADETEIPELLSNRDSIFL
ncbi:MAG: hypothetical protein KAR20_05400, partial [Candidatus Heimdallarchaeota archaeon]|nr:hypothetical protein [Candidatus Heimdallarchaeota archaeon]